MYGFVRDSDIPSQVEKLERSVELSTRLMDMRLHMVAIGTTGDVMPLLALGQELMLRGHRVQIAAFSQHAALIQSANMEFFPLPGDAYAVVSRVTKPGANPATIILRMVRSLHDVGIPFLQSLYDACVGADAMVTTFFGSCFASISAKLRIPYFQAHFYSIDRNDSIPIASAPLLPLGRLYRRYSYHVSYRILDLIEAKYLTPWRNALGLPVSHIAPRAGEPKPTLTLYAVSPMLFMRPIGWLETIHITGFWMRKSTESWTPSPALDEFLRAGPKPIYIGFGSMISGDVNALLRIVLRSLLKTGLRAVLASGWGGAAIDTLPPNVLLIDAAPHNRLFPLMRAVVHHGGAGTLAAGLTAGLPTLVVPFAGDQQFWASRVYALGLGPKPLPRNRVNARRLAKRLTELVNTPSYATAAQDLSRMLVRENGVQIAADLIERSI